MKELIINGKTVDLDENTKMDLQFVSFLFVGISSVSAPRSWTVSLPKTAVNMGLIEGASSSDYAGDFPYNNYVVNYYNKGFRLINDGKGILTKIGNRIEFVFTFGKAFEKIKLMGEKKLTELPEETPLLWNRLINLNDMSTGFGWCNFYSFTNEDRSFTSHADIPFSVLHPTVTFKWLINKIAALFNVDMTSLSNIQKMGTFAFPLRNSNAASNLQKDVAVSTTSSYFTLQQLNWYVIDAMNLFTLVDDSNFVKPEGLMRSEIIINCAVFSDSTNETIQLVVTDKNGVNRVIEDFSYIFIPNRWRYFLSTSFFLEPDDVYFFISSTSSVTVTESDLSFSFNGLPAFYNPNSDGGAFPIIPNLPDMTCADFIFQAMQLAGVFPEISDETPNVINFYSAATISGNKSIAKDWTDKLVKKTPRMSELSDVEFKFGNYAQKNTLAYKKDETNLLNTDDYLVVENDNLEAENKLVELKFAAGKRFSVSDITIDYPLYDIKVQSGVLVRNPKSQSNDVIGKIVNVSGVNYLKFTNDLLWSSIKAEPNYAAQQSLLNKPRYIKEYFFLKPEDVQGFSAKIPIYLKQYGKFYAVMKLQYRESDFSECELLEVKDI